MSLISKMLKYKCYKLFQFQIKSKIIHYQCYQLSHQHYNRINFFVTYTYTKMHINETVIASCTMRIE